MNDIKEKQKHFFEYINSSIIINNKVSHAYLIETKGYTEYKKVVIELIKNILTIGKSEEESKKIENLLDTDNYPDLKIINPDGNFIKKEQLITLENQYSKKSMLDNKLIYIIDPAEKLNPASANTILKFLEEPPEGIVAILITENKYNVLETIVSRCQCLSLVNDLEIEITEEINEFVADLSKPKNILIKYEYYLEKLFLNRTDALENLKLIEELLFKQMKEKVLNNEKNNIINQIELIEKEKDKLQYNLNLKLWLMNYIYEVMEVERNA